MGASDGAAARRGGEADGQPPRLALSEAVQEAMTQVSRLLGREAESVTGVRRDGDGWSVLVDVVELERVPSTTSVIATYRVDVDRDGELSGYERMRRYTRGTTDPA